jgi:hypothetical protein
MGGHLWLCFRLDWPFTTADDRLSEMEKTARLAFHLADLSRALLDENKATPHYTLRLARKSTLRAFNHALRGDGTKALRETKIALNWLAA